MRDLDPHQEYRRLHVLHALHLFRSATPDALRDVCRRAADRFRVPIALLTLIDRDRQIIKAGVGTDVTETPRSAALCERTIRGDDVVVSTNTAKDPRFVANPLVAGEPFVRFYAGAPLIYMRDVRLGSLCLLDLRPREFGPAEAAELAAMAEDAMLLIVERELAHVTDQVPSRSP